MNFIDNNPEGDVEDDIFEHECWWEQRVIQNDKMSIAEDDIKSMIGAA